MPAGAKPHTNLQKAGFRGISALCLTVSADGQSFERTVKVSAASGSLTIRAPQNALRPHDNRPVDQLASCRYGCPHYALCPGNILGRWHKAGIHVRNLLRVDAEFATEAQADGALCGVTQPFRVVDLRVNAIYWRRDAGQPRDQHQLRAKIQ